MALGEGKLVRSRANAGSGYFALGEIIRSDGRTSWVVRILTDEGVAIEERHGMRSNQLALIKDLPTDFTPSNKRSDRTNEPSLPNPDAINEPTNNPPENGPDPTQEPTNNPPENGPDPTQEPTNNPPENGPDPTQELTNNTTQNVPDPSNNPSPSPSTEENMFEVNTTLPGSSSFYLSDDDNEGVVIHEGDANDEHFHDEDPRDNELSLEDPTGDIDENAVELTNIQRDERRKRYKEEKEKLVSDNTTFEVKESKKIKFRVGVEVEITKGIFEGKNATITKKVSRLKWKIQIDGIDGEETLLSRDMKTVRDKKRTYKWQVVADMDDSDKPNEYDQMGVVGFDFNDFKNSDETSAFRKIFEHLWPGDWKQQLRNLNGAIRTANKNAGKKKKMREVSKHEWWKFIGIIIFGGAVGEGGEILWEKENGGGMREAYNFGEKGKDIMSHTRFKEIKAQFPKAFSDHEAKRLGDDWYPIRLLIDGFNANRMKLIAGSMRKVLDESMCAWKPRTSALGGLPVITFVKRKPKPLGTEFKNVADPETGILLFLEVQRGKEGMRESKYFELFGATMSCTLRLVEGSSYSGQCIKERSDARRDKRSEMTIGDSWFASVQVAEEMALRGHEFVGPVSILQQQILIIHNLIVLVSFLLLHVLG